MGQFDSATKPSYTLLEIERAIKHRELLYTYATSGDMDSLNLIIDADIAVKRANPTAVQLKTIDLVWRKGYSLVESGKLLGVTPQAVKFNLDLFKVKLKRVLDIWKKADEREAKK